MSKTPPLSAARPAPVFQAIAYKPLLPRFFGNQIPEVANFRLTDTMNAAKPLFESVWIPGKIVVDH